MWIFFVKQKTAYEMRISDWSSDVCSSDLLQCWSYVPQFLPPSWTEEMTKSYAISAETQSYLGETINQPNPARFRGKASDRFPNRLSPLHADRDAPCAP